MADQEIFVLDHTRDTYAYACFEYNGGPNIPIVKVWVPKKELPYTPSGNAGDFVVEAAYIVRPKITAVNVPQPQPEPEPPPRPQASLLDDDDVPF